MISLVPNPPAPLIPRAGFRGVEEGILDAGYIVRLLGRGVGEKSREGCWNIGGACGHPWCDLYKAAQKSLLGV